jgi:broad specificity phosphatase PhoE
MAKELYYTKLLLVRHGQAREEDGSYLLTTKLSELGRLQANALGKAIHEYGPIDQIYSSPYPRAVETANSIIKKMNLELQIMEELSEIYVPVTNLDDLKAEKYLELWKPEHRAIDDSETVQSFFSRVWNVCEHICKKNQNKTVAIVAHAGTITAIYRWAIGILPESPWTFMIEVGNATISEVEIWPFGKIENGSPRYVVIKSIGRTEHLDGIASKY